jgi:phospholipase A-2-activating protein
MMGTNPTRSFQEYKLSKTLIGHQGDVKDVVFVTPEILATGSRDKSVLLWDLNESTVLFPIDAHSDYVNAICCLHENEATKWIVSGGSDKVIYIHEFPTQKFLYSLAGHTENVCALSAIPESPNGFISASWDK